MRLKDSEVKRFYKLYSAFCTFANLKHKVIQGLQSPEQYIKTPLEGVAKLRDKIYADKKIFDEFLSKNLYGLCESELETVSSWRHFVKGDFVVYKQYQKHCAFVHNDNGSVVVYGVQGLYDRIGDILAEIPTIVKTVLLPFEGKIVYDGVLLGYSVRFGSGYRQSFKEGFDQAKEQFGIVLQLPFEKPSLQDQEIGKLRYYLKSEDNLEYYEYVIDELLEKNPQLIPVYHQEVGKLYSRKLKRRLKKIGIKAGWFAVYNDMLIASGKTKSEAKESAKQILPKDMQKDFVVFQVK